MKAGKDYVGIFVTGIFHDGGGNFLMAKRGDKARDRHGEWQFGGGTLEVGETFEQALRRETLEEFGAEIFDPSKIDVAELIRDNGHWLGVFYVAKIDRESVCIAEPVHDEIGWFKADSLPEPKSEISRREFELVKKILNL